LSDKWAVGLMGRQDYRTLPLEFNTNFMKLIAGNQKMNDKLLYTCDIRL
jgi:hypothetical protein